MPSDPDDAAEGQAQHSLAAWHTSPLRRAPEQVWQRLRQAPAAWRASTSRNERLIYQEVTFQAIIDAGAMSFMSVFLVRLGAPNWLVGLYTSLPALMALLVALPLGTLVQGRQGLVKTANWSRLIFRTTIGAFALLAWLPASLASYILVGARALIEVPGQAAGISFMSILGLVTPPETRPRMLSTRMAVNGIVAAAMGLLAGQWLDWAPYPLNYQLLFLTAFLSGLFSIYTLSFLQLPAATEGAGQAQRRLSLSSLLPLITKTPPFRSFCFAAFFFRLTMAMPTALYTIYRVRTLGASDAWIGILLTIERCLSVIAYFVLARFLSREKNRRWLWVSCVGIAFYPLTMALATTPAMLIMPAICGGIFGAGMNVFMSNTLLAVSPEEQRPTFIAADVFLGSITALVGPLMGTALADACGIGLALLISGGLRFVSGLGFWALGVGREKGP
jgi:hypothetical protein